MKIIKQLASEGKDSMKSLSYELEALIYANIKENYPNSWNGDVVTRSLFSDMKKLMDGKKIHTPGATLSSGWKLYQRKKDTESATGDLAVIVQISYHDGQIAEGVAYYDCAEKDPGKNSFSTLNKNKYKRLSSFAHHSQLLLFDYDPISGMAFPSTADYVIGSHPHNWNCWIPYTHAVTVPSNLAFMLGVKTTGMYKVSVPLSYQICYRYLYGLDLDFNKQALETAAGTNTARGNPKFLICISVTHGGAEPLNAYSIDKGVYSEFE
jgi:hypothetical protein